jgi:TetR/AcrR family transcriptional repressor of nem operon
MMHIIYKLSIDGLIRVVNMARVSRQQTEINRRTITEVSSRLFRERGIKGVSVSDLMSAAGLTHGGFYGHFESKDALAAHACRSAFERSAEKWRTRAGASAGGACAKAGLAERYLSVESCRNPGASCPAAALATDMAREPVDAPVRAAFAKGVEVLVDLLASMQQKGGAAADRQQALADFATMVGALVLARATTGYAISNEFLGAAKQRIVTPLKPVSRRSKP